MTEGFKINLTEAEIARRVRAILGVPEAFLTNDVVSSPVFINKAEKYINKAIKDYKDLFKEESEFDTLKVAAMYYISYLLCVGMDARLPKQMKNLSTTTILQDISWDEKAMDMLNKCQESISDFLEEYDIEEESTYNTLIQLSDEVEYPETSI